MADKGNLHITKLDLYAQQKHLDGANFTLYQGNIIIETNIITNNGGVANVNGLDVGHYTLVEVVAPTGYELNPPLNVVINQGANHYTIYNTPTARGSVNVTKTDPDDNPIANVVLILYRANDLNTPLGTFTTNAQGQVTITNQVPGNYVLYEISAPGNFHLNPNPFPFTINEGVNTLNLENTTGSQTYGELVIQKVDSVTNALLSGGLYTLSRGNVVISSTLTSVSGIIDDPNNLINLNNLPTGSYTLVETVAPVGYVLNSTPLAITLVTGTNNYTLENEPLPPTGDIVITKVDYQSGNPITNAEFGLYQNNILIDTERTNINGIAIFNDIPVGSYIVKETVRPFGYYRNITNYPIVLTNGDIARITVEDIQKPLPFCFTVVNNSVEISEDNTTEE